MRTLGSALIAVLIVATVMAADAIAQVPTIGAVPADLPAPGRDPLASRRETLLQERAAIRARVHRHNARCTSVERRSAGDCIEAQRVLNGDIEQYAKVVRDFNDAVRRAGECETVARRAERERRDIEKLRATNEMNQEELVEWTRLNDEAQTKAVLAGVRFVVAQYTADLASVRHSAATMAGQATALGERAERARSHSKRMEYLAALEAKIDLLMPRWRELMEKEVLKAGLDAEKVWRLARNTMHHEFRVAQRESEAIKDVLRDPEFKKVFTGGDLATPGLDVLSTLVQQAGESVMKLELGLKEYERMSTAASAAVEN